MVHLISFRLEISFLGKFGPKNQNCQFILKFGISPHGLEIPGGNWRGIFSPLTVRLKCTREIK